MFCHKCIWDRTRGPAADPEKPHQGSRHAMPLYQACQLSAWMAPSADPLAVVAFLIDSIQTNFDWCLPWCLRNIFGFTWAAINSSRPDRTCIQPRHSDELHRRPAYLQITENSQAIAADSNDENPKKKFTSSIDDASGIQKSSHFAAAYNYGLCTYGLYSYGPKLPLRCGSNNQNAPTLCVARGTGTQRASPPQAFQHVCAE